MKTLIAKTNTEISTPWGVLKFSAGSTIEADVYTNIAGLVEFTVNTKHCMVYMGALNTSDWEVFVPVALKQAA